MYPTVINQELLEQIVDLAIEYIRNQKTRHGVSAYVYRKINAELAKNGGDPILYNTLNGHIRRIRNKNHRLHSRFLAGTSGIILKKQQVREASNEVLNGTGNKNSANGNAGHLNGASHTDTQASSLEHFPKRELPEDLTQRRTEHVRVAKGTHIRVEPYKYVPKEPPTVPTEPSTKTSFSVFHKSGSRYDS